MAVGKAATFAQIDTLTLLLFYIPIFFLQGLVPAILAARQYYGPSFYLKIWGIKRRIFFITDPEGRKTVSKSAFIRMPDGLVAQVFGVSHKTVEMFVNPENIHDFGTIFQGIELKKMTSRHSVNLQKTIRECLDHGEKWSEGGLYDLCSTLVYESITTTLFGLSVNARSLVKDLKSFDTDVHLLAYPAPYRWFKPQLIRSRNKIAERLSSVQNDDSENVFTSKLNELASSLSKEDVGSINMAVLWAAYGNVIPAIFWTYFHLRHHPNIYEIILHEIESASSEATEDDAIYSMPHLDGVIEETMRLMANALTVRECMQDMKLEIVRAGYEVSLAENDILVLFPFASQIDEEYFPRPHEFIHDRFVTGSPNEISAAARRVHAPFGEGKFVCPGRLLGKNVIKWTIVVMIKQFDIDFFDTCEAIKKPTMLKSRQGFGIPPPQKDIRIRYRVK